MKTKLGVTQLTTVLTFNHKMMKKYWSKTKKVEFILKDIETNKPLVQHLKKISWTPREFQLILPRMTHKEIDFYYSQLKKSCGIEK